jgi:hypothetical protein
MSKKNDFQGLKVELDATGNKEIIKDLLQTTEELVDLMKTNKVKLHLVAEELKSNE